MRRTALALLAALLSPGLLPAQASPADSIAVVRLVEQFHARMQAADTNGAAALLAPELVVMEGGTIERLSDYVSHHLPADIDATRAAPSPRTVVHVAVGDGMATVASSTLAQREVRGQQMEVTGAELMVLRRTSAGWRISAIHWSSRNRRITPPAG